MLVASLIVEAIMTLVVYTAYILVISFILWMAIDAAKQDRYWWIVLITGVPIVGASVYYFTEKKHIYAEAPSHHIHTSETEIEHETSHKKHDIHKASEKGSHEVSKEAEKNGETV